MKSNSIDLTGKFVGQQMTADNLQKTVSTSITRAGVTDSDITARPDVAAETLLVTVLKMKGMAPICSDVQSVIDAIEQRKVTVESARFGQDTNHVGNPRFSQLEVSGKLLPDKAAKLGLIIQIIAQKLHDATNICAQIAKNNTRINIIVTVNTNDLSQLTGRMRGIREALDSLKIFEAIGTGTIAQSTTK